MGNSFLAWMLLLALARLGPAVKGEQSEQDFNLWTASSSSSSPLSSNANNDHESHHIHRELTLQDPRNVVIKPNLRPPAAKRPGMSSPEWTLPIKATDYPRPLNILSLGGSVTWGATLENRFKEAYPYLLGGPYALHVDNLAMRATGADYPSICLQSMVEGVDHPADVASSRSGSKNYDVILFDFVMNGTDGFPKLLQRLRTRYPQAIIVYVHIWSIKFLAVEEGTGKTVFQTHGNRDTTYVWGQTDTFSPSGQCDREICSSEEMEALVKRASGLVWKLPLPATPQEAIDSGLFANDWHHLSSKGHAFVAQSLLNVLKDYKESTLFKPKRLGSFGKGDACYNWFQTGTVAPIQYENAHKYNLYQPKHRQARPLIGPNFQKWTLQTSMDQVTTLTFDSDFDMDVPFGLSYMSQHQPKTYPVVDVSVVSPATNTTLSTRRIDPSRNHLQNEYAYVHIAVFSYVGMARPGTNTVQITTLPNQQSSSTPKSPLRIVGLYLCGHCADDLDTEYVMGRGAISSEALPSQPQLQSSL